MSGELSADTFRGMLDAVAERARERFRRVSERLEAFEESVPAQMRDEPVVAHMRTLIIAEMPIHPEDAKRITRAYRERLAEVAALS